MHTRFLLPVLLLVSTLSACGVSRTDARDRATNASCTLFGECEGFGEGKNYTSRDDCIVRQRSFWNDHLPADQCEESINTDALDICLKAIEITDCNNAFDLFNTAYGKCAASVVCAMP